jgi:hypothetical protein
VTAHARIRTARLLAAIQAEGGDWPTSRAHTLYRRLGAPQMATARRDLEALAAAGRLTAVETTAGRVYRLRGGRAAA